jgi:glutamyl-tRNA synthetase
LQIQHLNHGEEQNPDKDISCFDLQLNKMSVSGAVFDMVKLLDISKTVISKYDAETIYE